MGVTGKISCIEDSPYPRNGDLGNSIQSTLCITYVGVSYSSPFRISTRSHEQQDVDLPPRILSGVFHCETTSCSVDFGSGVVHGWIFDHMDYLYGMGE